MILQRPFVIHRGYLTPQFYPLFEDRIEFFAKAHRVRGIKRFPYHKLPAVGELDSLASETPEFFRERVKDRLLIEFKIHGNTRSGWLAAFGGPEESKVDTAQISHGKFSRYPCRRSVPGDGRRPARPDVVANRV